jgi:type II secretory pathway pseudopilin PulG
MELLVAVVVAGILAAVAVSGFGEVQGRLAVRSARASFLSSQAQARALAVERGGLVSLVADPAGDVVSVRAGCDGLGAILESLDYGESFTVDIAHGGGDLTLCMTPKGVASPSLNSFDDETTVAFWRGSSSAEVLLLPLGQVIVP